MYKTVEEMVNYVSEFYLDKPESIYPIEGVTIELIKDVVAVYIEHSKTYHDDYGFDSVDRENVREILKTLITGTPNI